MEDNENEVSLTDSAIMSYSGAVSTPVSTKEREESNHEMMNFMKLLVEKQNTIFCTKFDEMKEQNVKSESNFN